MLVKFEYKICVDLSIVYERETKQKIGLNILIFKITKCYKYSFLSEKYLKISAGVLRI